MIDEIKAIRIEIRKTLSRRDRSKSKISFRIEDKEKVIKGMDKLTDILADLVWRRDDRVRELESRELLSQITALKIEMKEAKGSQNTSDGLQTRNEAYEKAGHV